MQKKPKKVLLIEDGPSQRRLLKKIFIDGWGCDVHEAEDGLAALNILLREELRPDLIILDLLMPYISGMEFLRIIKGRPEFNELPIIICSSVDNPQTVREIAQYGIKDILVKPIDRFILSKKVNPFLQP